jgi:hypothetical protein
VVSACSPPAEDEPAPPAVSVYDQMVNIISPSANVLWAVEVPASDADWQPLIAAADTIIASGGQIRAGGSGVDDVERAANPEWQAYLDTMIGAAIDARKAAAAQDLDALLIANDVLYPPCEECHLQFHPGVREQEFN